MRRYLLVLDMDLLARGRHRDPVHQLRRRWGQRLVLFGAGTGTKTKQ